LSAAEVADRLVDIESRLNERLERGRRIIFSNARAFVL